TLDRAPTQMYTPSLHDALPISGLGDREHLVVLDHDEGAHEPTLLLIDQLHRLDAGAGAALHAVLLDRRPLGVPGVGDREDVLDRSEEHTSELQSRENLVCRLLL